MFGAATDLDLLALVTGSHVILELLNLQSVSNFLWFEPGLQKLEMCLESNQPEESSHRSCTQL